MSAVGNRRERGFSLAEVMVASAIMIVVIVGILLLYDRANKVFKSGNEAAEMQQNVRIAYDRMVADVRMAGFDYKRGGQLLPGQTAAPWASGRSYSAGTIVTASTPNGHTYRATNSGISGTTEPGWPTGTGATVVENGATPAITWQENGGSKYEQPDEQIEYAGATALAIRANFDYSANVSGDVDHGREPNLESSQFPIVTTGNDEIVTYGLVSNTAASGSAPNTQSITFFADTGVPRHSYPGGSAEDTVTISGVDLTNNNPPYTLYRFTIANDGTIQRTPLADNIRSLNFFYFEDPAGTRPLTDSAGTTFVPNVGGSGQYDPAVANSWNATNRVLRKKIRSIRVRLVGMSAVKDVKYTDTTTMNGSYSSSDTAGMPVFASDTVAPNYRRLSVDTLVVPRNLGMAGLAQNFLQPPPQPTLSSVCVGYCGIAVVNWNPNTNNPDASYVVEWDTSPTGSFSHALDAGTSNTYAVDLTQEDLTQTFYFRVRANNAGGGVVSTNTISASALNATKPSAPLSIAASGGGVIAPVTGKIRLTWSAPSINESGAPSCTPSGSPTLSNYLSEIKGFRIYRSTTANFTASSCTGAPCGNMILDENASGTAAPQTDGYGNYIWEDTGVASCGVTYYYRIKTVEWCAARDDFNTTNDLRTGLSSASDPSTPGSAGTTGAPGVPVNLVTAPLAPAAPPTGMTNSVCDSNTNNCNVNLRWSKVTQDVNGNSVSIDSYDIEVTRLLLGVPSGPGPNPRTVTLSGQIGTPGSNISFTDSGELMFDATTHANYTYQYRVRANQPNPCPNGAWSTTAQFPPPCTFTGSVVVETGATEGDGLTPPSSWVMNAGDVIEVQAPSGTQFLLTTMQIVDSTGAVISTQSSTNAGTPASRVLFTWIDQAQGTYTVTFTMTNNSNPQCTEQLVRYIQQQPPPACHITTFDVDNSILHQTATTYQLQLDLKNLTTEDLTMTEIAFSWTQPTKITWQTVKFPSAVGATVAGPGTTSGAFTITLSPKPGQLSTNDITIPANGTRSLLLNFAKTNGNPNNVVPGDINSICISYTQPLQGSTILHCRIHPSPAANNPTSCN